MSTKKVKIPSYNEKQIISAANKTIKGLENFAKAKGKLFDSIRASLETVKSQHDAKKALTAYKRLVAPTKKEERLEGHIDRSTLDKMIKIVESEVVMKNLHRLPESWATLHKIACEEENCPKVVQGLIDERKIGASSTLANVKELFTTPKVEEETETEVVGNPLELAAEGLTTEIEVAGQVFEVLVSNVEVVLDALAALEKVGVQLSADLSGGVQKVA